MSRRRILRLILFAALAVGLMILGHQIGASPSPAALRARIAAAGPVGPLVFLGVFIAGQLLHAPGVPFIATAILCFGKLQGGVLAWAGAILGTSASFLLFRAVVGEAPPLPRRLDRPVVRRILQHLHDRPVRTVLVVRALFLLSPPISLALSLSAIRYRHYLLGSSLGLIPPMTLCAVFFDWLVRRL